MKKLALAFLMIGLFGFTLSGCRAEAEIDTRSTPIVPR
jgi:hypothetical protein